MTITNPSSLTRKLKRSSVAIVTAFSLVGFTSVQATEKMPVEEKRGLVSGLLIGGAVGGPIGAGAGALVGSNVFGKFFATLRENRSLREELTTLAALQESAHQQYVQNTTMLNRDLDKLIEVQSKGLRQLEAPIQFRTGSSKVEAHYKPQLEKVAGLLARNPDATVVLSGFADRRGNRVDNSKLSEARVRNVQHFLFARGVKRDQVITTAYGESKPLHPSESLEGNFFDRRVVMEISLDIDAQLATR